MKNYYSLSEAAEMLGKSKETLRRWDREGKLEATREPMSNYRVYKKSQLDLFFEFIETESEQETDNFVIPNKEYKVLV